MLYIISYGVKSFKNWSDGYGNGIALYMLRWYRQDTSIKKINAKYKYGIDNKILSSNILGGVCTLPEVQGLYAFQLITSTISLDPRLIHEIMPTCIFNIITEMILLPKRGHLIIIFFSYLSQVVKP